MNLFHIRDEIMSGREVFMYDDYEEAAIRIIPRQDSEVVYLKRHGKKEFIIDRTEKIVFEIMLGGQFITPQQYESI